MWEPPYWCLVSEICVSVSPCCERRKSWAPASVRGLVPLVELKSPEGLAVCGAGDFRSAVAGEIGGMFHFGNGTPAWLLAVAAAAAIALAIVWLGFDGSSSSPELARDYEDCVERVQAQSPPGDELNGQLAGCGARFAGRRKLEGGYTYYDFMQDRKFDIAGPNPTVDERKAIDRQYIVYLEAQRRRRQRLFPRLRMALAGTELERAQCGTIRLKLLKIGALVQRSFRRIVIHLSGAFPLQGLVQSLATQLSG